MPDDTARPPSARIPAAPAGVADGYPDVRTDRPMRRRSNAMLAATLWSLIGITALGLTRLIYSALIGRAEGPALLGSVNNAVSLSFLATFVTAGATGQAVTKYVARSAGAGLGTAPVRRLLDRLTIGATVAAAGVVVALSPWLFAGHELTAGPAGPAARWRTGALVAVLVLAYAGYTYAKAVLYGYQLARRYAGLEVVADLAALALTVAVLVAGQPGWLLAPLIVGYGGFTLLALRSARGSAGQPSRPAGSTPAPAGLSREIVGFVALTCLGTVASQGFFQACMVVAGKTLTAPGAGLYAAAMTAVTPAFLLPRALALAFFPAAASAVGAGNRASLARQVDVSTRALASLSLPVLVLGAVLAPVLLPAVFGPPYGGAAGAVAVLAAAIWLYVCAVPSVNALSAHGLAWARIPPFASAAGVLLGVGVWLVLMVVLGRRGPAVVAAGYLASTVLQAGVPMLLARRRLGMRPGGFGVRIGSSAVLGAAAVLAWPVTGRLWLSVLVTVVFAVCHPLLLGADVRRLRGWARRSGVEHPSGDDSGRASDDQL